MRLLTAALCTTVAAALLAACSSNGSSPSSALPGSPGGVSNASHGFGMTPMVPFKGHWVPLLHHGNIYEAIPVRITNGKSRVNPPPAGATKGLYVQQFFSTTDSVVGYPKNNSANGPPVCTIASGSNVNDFGTDRNGVIIVPAAFSGIEIYMPPPSGGTCGTLLGTIPESGGQSTSADALDAVNGTIVVGNIGGGTSTGVYTCTLSSNSCTALTSPAMSSLAGVAMDKQGNCYADAFDTSGHVGLWVYTGCAGTGTELTASNGFNEPYYGGISVDNSGHIATISLFNSSFSTPSLVTVYSGCSTGTCTVVGGPYTLNGESVFGHLGPRNDRWATTNLTSSDAEVYTYTGRGTGLSFMYSFNNGLTCATNDCESANYGPGSPR